MSNPGFEGKHIAAACHLCGSGRSLRFTPAGWVCFNGCSASSSKPTPPGRKKGGKARPALFGMYWEDGHGHRLGRASRLELREAWRLWAAHKDIREGKQL